MDQYLSIADKMGEIWAAVMLSSGAMQKANLLNSEVTWPQTLPQSVV